MATNRTCWKSSSIVASGCFAMASLLLSASPALAQGTWAQATEVTAPATAGSNPTAFLNGISCSSVGNCTAAGDYPDTSGNVQAMAVTETSGTWAQATEVTAPANAAANLALVSTGSRVPRSGTALPSGTTGTPLEARQAMAATETSGTWAQATEVTAPANAGTTPALLSTGSRVPRSGTAPQSAITSTALGTPGDGGHRDLGHLGAGH